MAHEVFRVAAFRSDDWWALEFEVDGRVHSQVRRLEQAPAAAAAALSEWFAGERPPISPAQIRVSPQLDDVLRKELAATSAARVEAAEAAAVASDRTASFVLRCVDEGLSLRDIGTLLSVSHQYVAKVAKQAHTLRDPPLPATSKASPDEVVLGLGVRPTPKARRNSRRRV